MSDLPARKYPPFQPGFFTERVCKLLCDIGEGALTQQVRNVGPTIRNNHIARQEIYRRYLTPEDIATAAWICAKDTREHPDWNNTYSGTEHLNKLLLERSNGRYVDEIKAVEKSLPPPLANNNRGFPMPALMAEIRALKKRDQFVLIQGGQDTAGAENSECPAP